MVLLAANLHNGTPTKGIAQFEIYLNSKVRSGTVSLYVTALRKWLKWCKDSGYTSIGSRQAQGYIDAMIKSGLSPNTVGVRGHGIMRYLRWRGVPTRLDLPSIKQSDPVYLKPNEMDKVIANCRDLLEKSIVVVLYDTAIRISELLGLKVEDIDRSQMLITVVRKGGDNDLVNISKQSLDVLDRWMKSHNIVKGKVFLNLEYRDAWKIIKAIGERAGFGDRVHPHIFRHSRAIQMLMNHTDMYIVQRHLGHKSITTTMNIYGKFMAIDIKKSIPSI